MDEESRKSKKLVKLEVYENTVLSKLGVGEEGGDGVDEDDVDAFEWMDRVEIAADRGGPHAGDGAWDSGVRMVAEEAGVAPEDIIEAMQDEGEDGAAILLQVLRRAMESPEAGEDVERWYHDDVSGTDGRMGRPLTKEEAGLVGVMTEANAEDVETRVVHGREGETGSRGHWWE